MKEIPFNSEELVKSVEEFAQAIVMRSITMAELIKENEEILNESEMANTTRTVKVSAQG